jgi:hypothetical protein
MLLKLPKERVFRLSLRFRIVIGVSVIAFIVTGEYPVLLLGFIGLWGLTAKRGVVLRSEDGKMKRFYEVFGLTFGQWESIKPNKALVMLQEDYSISQESFAGNMRFEEGKAYSLYLVNETHRKKVKLATVIEKSSLDEPLEDLEEHFNLKLVKYAPAISARTRALKNRR